MALGQAPLLAPAPNAPPPLPPGVTPHPSACPPARLPRCLPPALLPAPAPASNDTHARPWASPPLLHTCIYINTNPPARVSRLCVSTCTWWRSAPRARSSYARAHARTHAHIHTHTHTHLVVAGRQRYMYRSMDTCMCVRGKEARLPRGRGMPMRSPSRPAKARARQGRVVAEGAEGRPALFGPSPAPGGGQGERAMCPC